MLNLIVKYKPEGEMVILGDEVYKNVENVYITATDNDVHLDFHYTKPCGVYRMEVDVKRVSEIDLDNDTIKHYIPKKLQYNEFRY